MEKILYTLNRLSSHDPEEVEEHLPVCRACQDRLEETDTYVKAMRAALVSVGVRWVQLERQIKEKGP